MAMKNITTGVIMEGTPTQAQADQGWVPVADTQAPGSSPSGTASVTPQLTLNEAQKQADTAISSGLVSPMSLSDIRAREAAQKASSAASVEAQFAPQLLREAASGRRTVAGAEGSIAGAGIGAGGAISSAAQAFLAATQADVNTRIKIVEDQKAAALTAGDLAAVTRADEAISKLNEYNNNLTIAKADYALKLMGQNLQERQLDATTANTEATRNLQSEELKLNAYKTALETPVGKEFVVNGTTYIGLKDASGIDPANITISTDDKGYETGINKITGEVIWKSKVPTGKTKTQAANVTVNMKNSAIGGVQDTMYGLDGSELGTRSYNEQTGKWTYQDYQGNTISAPSFYTTTKPKTTGSIELNNGSGKTIKIN